MSEATPAAVAAPAAAPEASAERASPTLRLGPGVSAGFVFGRLLPWVCIAALAFVVARLLPASNGLIAEGQYGGHIMAFMGIMVSAALGVSFMMTAQAWNSGRIDKAILGATLLMLPIIAIVQIAFSSKTGVPNFAGRNMQQSAALWVQWHFFLPLAAGVSCLSESVQERLTRAGVAVAASRVLIVVSPMLSVLMGWFVMTRTDALVSFTGDLAHGKAFAPAVLERLGPAVVAVHVAALIAINTSLRRRDQFHHWLSVSIVASLAASILSLTGGSFTSTGYYYGRYFGLASTIIILGALLAELCMVYSRTVSVNETLAAQAQRDGLTRLRNRRYLDAKLDAYITAARTKGSSVSLLLLDLDHFKALNDSFGHLAGDSALVQVARVLESCARRGGDVAARFGGEEFCLVMPDSTAQVAAQVGERIRAGVQRLGIAAASGGSLTASLGVVTLAGAQLRSAHELIARADSALYAAKSAGRNRVHVWERPA